MKKKILDYSGSNGTPTKTPAYQLVKEVNHIDGTTYYWTVDSEEALVTSTMTTNEDEAKRIFKIVCKNNGKTLTKTVMDTYYEE